MRGAILSALVLLIVAVSAFGATLDVSLFLEGVEDRVATRGGDAGPLGDLGEGHRLTLVHEKLEDVQRSFHRWNRSHRASIPPLFG